MTKNFDRYINVLKALSDETRLNIVHMLSCRQMCANDLLECFHITQPTLSYHMKILSKAGVVKSTRQASYTIYSVDQQTLNLIFELFCLLKQKKIPPEGATMEELCELLQDRI
ncbi:metalloregulator ArsR/SmtB family transcription factor [Eubacteriales bacterium OttesenSCG-928-K08]|nr:metalloregulator ArsR/SmtB family transcription factor [Eubacteriales bacterium OttesenSCG-928-K08]